MGDPVVRPDGTIDWSGVAPLTGIFGPATASGSAAAPGGISGPATATSPAVRLSVPKASNGYPYQPGVDPTYDGWLAQYANNKNTANNDAELRRRTSQQTLDDQLAGISTSADTNRKNLRAGLLQRGVYQSGETGLRQAELEAGVLRQQTQAQTGFATTANGITSDLDRAIADLDRQNIDQVGNAISRQTARQDALTKAGVVPAADPAPVAAPAPAPLAPAAAPARAPARSPGRSIAPTKKVTTAAAATLGAGLGAMGPARGWKKVY